MEGAPAKPDPVRRLGHTRSDSTSSLDSRSSRDGGVAVSGERLHPKHSRKPQQVFKRLSEGREGEGQDGEGHGRGRADSLSVSVDWGSLPSSAGLNNGGFLATPTNLPPLGDAGGTAGSMEVTGGGASTPPSAIVSLPLMFSAARAESSDSNNNNAESASLSAQQPAEESAQKTATDATSSREGSAGHTHKVKPLSAEVVRPVVSVSGGSGDTSPKRDRGVAESGSVQGPFSSGPRGIAMVL